MIWLFCIGYGLILLVVVLFQRRLIYFPSRFPENVALQLAAENGLSAWRDRDNRIIGWKIAATGESVGSVLITHGNAGSALDRDYLATPIHHGVPLDVYVLEYPGYGTRDGSPSMSSILAAAEEAFDELPKDKPVYLVSESIGAGAAAHLAKRHPSRIKGMAMFVPFDDLGNVGQRSMPWLPVKLLLLDRYRPARWLEDYSGPIKIVLADADEVIPVCFGQQLFDGCKGVKSCQLVPNARHNDVADQSPEWWKEVYAFWQQTAGK